MVFWHDAFFSFLISLSSFIFALLGLGSLAVHIFVFPTIFFII